MMQLSSVICRMNQSMSGENVLKELQELSSELQEIRGSTLERLEFPFDLLHFQREFVSNSKPCIIKGAIDDWKALKAWNSAYLLEKFRNLTVPVTLTPNGKADAVTEMHDHSHSVFALPAEERMTMETFLGHLTFRETCQRGNVMYIQQQNDCLRQEFSALLEDIDPEPAWATRLFGSQPEAVNIWIGGAESVTSFHKDHYENMFSVICGAKHFTLLPPADVYRLAIGEYPVARYHIINSGADLRTCGLELKLVEPAAKVRWSPVDPNAPASKHPLFFNPDLPQPLKVTVPAGEMLYLPSLWHHYVEQTPGPEGLCVAVNMWFDMAIDFKYAYFSMIEKISEKLAGVL